MNDPTTVEIHGEAFTYPARITKDANGDALREAAQVVRNLTARQFDKILGDVDDWPQPKPHVNADRTESS
ncbi:hypothetical protein ACIA2T_04695 [Amycolatopsis japonica]|uniref:hypothetical protein n=1 Tax=Amycolatopsis japonica TaxID=208439 RepID=UPI0037A09CD9